MEVTVGDPSDFETELRCAARCVHGRYRVLTLDSATVPNALAALLLDIRDAPASPHIYFDWTEGNPFAQLPALPPVRPRRGRPGHPRGSTRGRARPVSSPARPRRVNTPPRSRGAIVIPLLIRTATTADAEVVTAAFGLALATAFVVSALTRRPLGDGHHVTFDDAALALAARAVRGCQLHLVAIESQTPGSSALYRDNELAQRDLDQSLTNQPVLFLEIDTSGRRTSASRVHVRGIDLAGYHVLRTDGPTTPEAIATIVLELRDTTRSQPHLHFTWPDGESAASPFRCTLLPALTPHRICRCLHSIERDAARTPARPHRRLTAALSSTCRAPARRRSGHRRSSGRQSSGGRSTPGRSAARWQPAGRRPSDLGPQGARVRQAWDVWLDQPPGPRQPRPAAARCRSSRRLPPGAQGRSESGPRHLHARVRPGVRSTGRPWRPATSGAGADPGD